MAQVQEMAIVRLEWPSYIAEWTPNGQRYYPINLKNIRKAKQFDAAKYREIMNRILSGAVEIVKASYDRKNRILTIWGNGHLR